MSLLMSTSRLAVRTSERLLQQYPLIAFMFHFYYDTLLLKLPELGEGERKVSPTGEKEARHHKKRAHNPEVPNVVDPKPPMTKVGALAEVLGHHEELLKQLEELRAKREEEKKVLEVEKRVLETELAATKP
ncbi:hypothetical protein F511_37173 [Dorcoceras hygrometricum]|uniref:Uncharacterized protein n=1 Tax=Dorcoceras hygrometricum TaxID=472368 RepID=A0A2Z7D8D7_9LAMI|nr:hypothetical protein F511_37173 [Dorcoceras hygrometricum]